MTVTLAAGWQLGSEMGTVSSGYALHGWVVASFIVVGVMAIALLAASAVLLAINMLLLSRVKDFAWARFFEVFEWSLLAYTIVATLILYVFVNNGLTGGPLIVLGLSLLVFALHVPLLIGFTVARYAD